MDFFPYESFHIVTGLDANAIQKELNKHIAPANEGLLMGFFTDHYFNGVARQNRFKLRSNAYHRNSIRPIIIGLIQSHAEGSVIRVKMSMLWVAWAVHGIAIGILLLISVAFTVMVMAFDANTNLLVTYAVALCWYVVVLIGFKMESRKDKEFLMSILAAQEARKPVTDKYVEQPETI